MQAALALDPTLPHAPVDLGIAYFNSGQYAQAKAWLERAYHENVERFTSALFLGLTLYRLGDDAAAQKYLKEAEADPELRPTAQYYTALALLHEGKTSAARSLLQETARKYPQFQVGQVAGRYSQTAAAPQPTPGMGPEKPWSVYAQLGFVYDSNVVAGPSESSVPGRTGISGESDGSTVIGLGGQYTLLNGNYGSLLTSYDFYQSVHFSLTQFDLQGHSVRLNYASKPGRVTYGIAGAYDFYALDYQSFYQEGIGTPWVAVAEGDHAATQVYYRLRGREFFRSPYSPYRDGINYAGGLREYLALGDGRTLGVGYQFDSENPRSSGPGGHDFRYNGNQLDAALTLPFPNIVRAQLAYLLRFEDYRFPNSRPNQDGTQVRRHDVENELVVDLAHDLTPHVALTLDYIGIFNNSNIPDFQYDRHIVSTGVRVVF